MFSALFLCLFFSQASFSQVGISAEELSKELSLAPKMKGLQVGLVVDSRKEGKKIWYEVVTLKARAATAFDVVEKSRITKVYHPQYQEPPMVMVLSLDGEAPDKASDGKKRSWAFFLRTEDGRAWTPAQQGVAGISVKDGDLIGFSRTAWAENKGAYKPQDEPRM